MSDSYVTPVPTSDGRGALRAAATKKKLKYRFTVGTTTYVGRYNHEVESNQGIKLFLMFSDGSSWALLAEDCVEVQEPDENLTLGPANPKA